MIQGPAMAHSCVQYVEIFECLFVRIRVVFPARSFLLMIFTIINLLLKLHFKLRATNRLTLVIWIQQYRYSSTRERLQDFEVVHSRHKKFFH